MTRERLAPPTPFITREGPDGSGKTTQLTLLAQVFGQQGETIASV